MQLVLEVRTTTLDRTGLVEAMKEVMVESMEEGCEKLVESVPSAVNVWSGTSLGDYGGPVLC